MTAVDLFAGCGGWDLAARELGFDPIGVEMDGDACATRALHGMPTIRADVTTLDPARFRDCEGLIASPPCPDWSNAGSGLGMDGATGHLVTEVLRWATIMRPRWVACEQVPAVLPVWQQYAHELRALGYRTWVGQVQAEMYGVPQTRRRAILLAHRDRAVTCPAPTHQRYVHGEAAGAGADCQATMFSAGMLPWVSMADALGWGMTARPMLTLSPGTAAGGADAMGVGGSGARRTINDERDAGRWRLTDRRENGCERATDEPAPTITSSLDNGDKRWARDESEGSIRLHIDEGKILQSFPHDFAVSGSVTAQWRQIGNAVPPLLASHLLGQVVGAVEAVAA